MKTRLLPSILALLIVTPLFAQVPDKAKLDSYFNALEANNKFMGTVSISKDGKTVYTRSIGYLDSDKKSKLNENSKFRIGSISKTFTAAMIFKAIDEKKLTVETKLDKFFPTVPNASKITIGHLLGHRSGIHNFTDDESYLTWNTLPQTEAQMISIITKGGSDFEPNTKAEYSNSNYVLLTYILEKTYKKPFKELVDKAIIKPLGLKNTYYGGKINTAANEALSYKFNGAWVKEKETDMSIPLGAGAIVSNPSDLTRFFEALFAGKVVSQASLDQMKAINEGYGMGLFRFPFNEKSAYGHNGGIDGFTSMAAYLPEDKVAMALTSNASAYDNNNIAIAALSWIFDKPFEIPDFTSYSYKSEELDKYLGIYSSSQVPLKITVTKEGTILVAQATGQSAFPLDATNINIFKFERAGIVMEFNPEKKLMILRQGGQAFSFTKE